ncbi:MAG: LacI family DNA-binding transcriptional regulator [Candidatus Marinimicrobia bacterium]|nr:LacI family DNA-binding transcriptional regulator [Candidatus Neomarinimicrobiota bacterium]
MKKIVTIKDIAKELGVSPSTVSRALRDHPYISDETKRKVKELANKLQYKPNIIARSLQMKRTHLIGVIVPEIEHRFFSAAISGIEEVAYREGFAIIVTKSNEDYRREEININVLVETRVAGLLISISETTRDRKPFEMLIKSGIPFVFFDRVIDDVSVPKVAVDDFEAAYKAVEYLIKSGYKRICHLAGPKFLSISKKRAEGYREAMRAYNISVDDKMVVYGGMHETDGASGFITLINNVPDLDAIFAVNDPVAIGAIMEAKKLGYRIPGDIAFVGFSNNPISAMIEPALTTVDQPAYNLGKTAAEVLIRMINEGTYRAESKVITLKTHLIIRDTT